MRSTFVKCPNAPASRKSSILLNALFFWRVLDASLGGDASG
jgi:hypothetical protein